VGFKSLFEPIHRLSMKRGEIVATPEDCISSRPVMLGGSRLKIRRRSRRPGEVRTYNNACCDGDGLRRDGVAVAVIRA
jgi:hypothetical protein